MYASDVIRALAVTLGCLLVLGACDKAGDKPAKEEKQAAPACAESYQELPDPKGEVTCSCPAEAGEGVVWGTDVFTADSGICVAAVHAGVLPAGEGGEVTVIGSPGCRYYRGTSANGVESNDFGAHDASYFFVGHGDGACDVLCPSSFNQLSELSDSTELSCKCRPDLIGGTVWGSGVYTQDSSVCGAAVHAGVITAEQGGDVTAKAAPGCKGYEDSEANGIASERWGEFDASFYFPAKGEPVCSNICPDAFASIPDVGDTTELTCKCRPNTLGTVYGSGTFTRDSSICAAAVHAGVVASAAGGEVTVKASPGCAKYVGSVANGVSSTQWSAYDGSFYFPAQGDGACAP